MNQKLCILFLMIIFVSGNLFAAEYDNVSLSVDPITFLQMLFSSNGEAGNPEAADFANMWLSASFNWENAKQKELGFGVFLSGHNIALTTQYRSFFNKEKQSGLFWGFYGRIEWRRMYWNYDDNSELSLGWSLPFPSSNNAAYHSLGISGGVDIGFRLRIGNFGITPYAGLGIPLFFFFGNLPPKDDRLQFTILNVTARAIHIGVKFDFFL